MVSFTARIRLGEAGREVCSHTVRTHLLAGLPPGMESIDLLAAFPRTAVLKFLKFADFRSGAVFTSAVARRVTLQFDLILSRRSAVSEVFWRVILERNRARGQPRWSVMNAA